MKIGVAIWGTYRQERFLSGEKIKIAERGKENV